MYVMEGQVSDTWYGKGILSFLKHVPEGTQLEPLIGPGNRVVIRIKKLTVLFKRSRNKSKLAPKEYGQWHFTFGSRVRDFLNKESARGQKIVDLLVCTGGPIVITIERFNKDDNLNTAGSKNIYVTSKTAEGASKPTYFVTDSLDSRQRRKRVLPIQAQDVWSRILKVNSGA